MSTRRGLKAREVLSVLTDIPDDVSEYGDESCTLDADDDFIPATDESSSSSEYENVNATSMQCEWSFNVSIFVFFEIGFVFCVRYNIQAQAVCKVIWNLMRRMGTVDCKGWH